MMVFIINRNLKIINTMKVRQFRFFQSEKFFSVVFYQWKQTASLLIINRGQQEKFLRYSYFNEWKRTASKLKKLKKRKKLKKLRIKQCFNDWKKETLKIECPLCMSRVPKADCYTTDCGHTYCNNCFKKWVDQCETKRSHTTCPVCREKVNGARQSIQDDAPLPQRIEQLIPDDDEREVHSIRVDRINWRDMLISDESYWFISDGNINWREIFSHSICISMVAPEIVTFLMDEGLRRIGHVAGIVSQLLRADMTFNAVTEMNQDFYPSRVELNPLILEQVRRNHTEIQYSRNLITYYEAFRNAYSVVIPSYRERLTESSASFEESLEIFNTYNVAVISDEMRTENNINAEEALEVLLNAFCVFDIYSDVCTIWVYNYPDGE